MTPTDAGQAKPSSRSDSDVNTRLIEDLRDFKDNEPDSYHDKLIEQAIAEIERLRVDAERYAWLRQRVRVRKEQAMSGSSRDAFDFRIGCSFVDSKTVPGAGYTDPARFVADCARVDASIDAALAAT